MCKAKLSVSLIGGVRVLVRVMARVRVRAMVRVRVREVVDCGLLFGSWFCC